MPNKKAFFRERTEAEIKKLILQEAEQKGLIDKLLEMGDNDALILISKRKLTPLKYDLTGDSAYASRNHLRKGFYIALTQPITELDAIREERRPYQIRESDLTRKLSKREENEIYALGYSYQTIDSQKRIFIPFWSIMEGCMRDSYEENVCEILPEEFRQESRIRTSEISAKENGAVVFMQVPSSEEGIRRYEVRFNHVPIIDSIEKTIIGWNTTSECATNPHEHNNFQMDNQEQKIVEPQEVHAYHKIVRHYLAQGNHVPFEMCQFAIPAKISADIYRKLNNNFLIFDSSLDAKDKLRKPRLNELSIIIARLVGKLGVKKTMFWDYARDGMLKDYKWR